MSKNCKRDIRETVASIMASEADIPEPIIGLTVSHKKFGDGVIVDVGEEKGGELTEKGNL